MAAGYIPVLTELRKGFTGVARGIRVLYKWMTTAMAKAFAWGSRAVRWMSDHPLVSMGVILGGIAGVGVLYAASYAEAAFAAGLASGSGKIGTALLKAALAPPIPGAGLASFVWHMW